MHRAQVPCSAGSPLKRSSAGPAKPRNRSGPARNRILAALLVLVVALLAIGPARAQAPSLSPPLPRGAVCGGIVPCADSGPVGVHLRLVFGLSSPLPGTGSPLWPGGALSVSLTGPASWFEGGFSVAAQVRTDLSPTRFDAGPLTLWARLSPSFLAGLFSNEKHGGLSIAGWLAYDIGGGPFSAHGTIYPDAQTYGAALQYRLWRLDARLYGAYQGADDNHYKGIEAGGGLWVTLVKAFGFQLGGELLTRAGQHVDTPATGGVTGFVGFRSFDGDEGLYMGGGYAPRLSGSAGPAWAAVVESGASWGPSFRPSRWRWTPMQEAQVRAVMLAGLPQLPQLIAPGCNWHDPITVSRGCQVAGYGLGLAPLALGMPPNREWTAQRPPDSAGPPSPPLGPSPVVQRGPRQRGPRKPGAVAGGAEREEAREQRPDAEPFETPAERAAREAREVRERQTETDPNLPQHVRDRLRVRHQEEARQRAAQGPYRPALQDGPSIGMPRDPETVRPAPPQVRSAPAAQATPVQAMSGSAAPSSPSRGMTRRVPNPDGSNGKADHRATVKRLEDRARGEFPDEDAYEIKLNKSIKDNLPGKANRRPDVSVINRDTERVEKVYEAARTNKDGTFVPRERKKVDEYKKAGIPFHMEPVK